MNTVKNCSAVTRPVPAMAANTAVRITVTRLFTVSRLVRYVITPIKVPDPSDESGKKKREALCAEVWPGPWSIEHTAEEKIETQLFDGDQAGLDKAVAWLHERYTAEADRWADIPSILDCEPDR